MFPAIELEKLLREALSAEELEGLCFYDEHFRAVHDKFVPALNNDLRIRELISYAEKRGLQGELVDAVERINAVRAKAFRARMAEKHVAAPETKSVPPPTVPPTPVQTCDVLLLAANPSQTKLLDLNAEADLIRQRLAEGEAGQRLRVHTAQAVRPEDLGRLLLQYDPLILHFSGHGSSNGDLILEGAGGAPQPVPVEGLAQMIGAIRESRLECVVFNACYTLERAEPLADRVRCVVGMARAFDDAAARRFAGGFYRGLGFGQDYLSAFDLGCAEVALQRLPDADVPHLLSRDPELLDPSLGPARVNRTTPIAAQQPQGGRWWYPLWYGTHRVPVADGYSAERDTTIHYGSCRVAIPTRRPEIGTLGPTWLGRLLAAPNSDVRLDRRSLRSFPDAPAFWADVKEALGKVDLGERSALVFIHGYNVSFEDAALRAAQVGFDLQLPGITAFYSWPSQANWRKYPADEAAIGASHGFLAEFLTDFVRQSEAEQVHLIAHSMGNRALLRGLPRVLDAVGRDVPFGQIFLAAPDVDAAEFAQEAAIYRRAAKRTTLYASNRDQALRMSVIYHGFERAGFVPPWTVVEGLDTVEVSKVDVSWLGHSYFGTARELLQDLRTLLLHNDPPEKRLGLRQKRTPLGQPYWMIGA